jgi:mono/diheme cytochrome c family protein
MRKNKFLLLSSSLGVLLLLVVAAVQENVLKEWRRLQRQGRTEGGPIPVQLRQVVNPTLQFSDRCVSCHVTMGPGDQSVTGAATLVAHKPVVHDPADYGCTVCHGGQGQATERADAHGSVHFWPEPMLPLRFSYAGCGTCHTPLGVPNQSLLQQARLSFERLDCLACHRLDGRGGTLRPDRGGMEGTDLSRVGLTGYDKEWYRKHLKKSTEDPARAWKVAFAPIGEPDLELLATFLATRMAAPNLVEAKALFHSSGCLGCHKVSGVGGSDGPDLSRAGEKDPGQLSFAHVPGQPVFENWLAEHFRSPVAIVPGSQMPALRLSSGQIDQLTLYVLSLRRRELPGTYLPKDQTRVARFGEREFATDGATLFSALCSGCHGPHGGGLRSPGLPPFPSNTSPDFLSLVSDEFLTETVRRGRPGRRMPAWGEMTGGLRPEEIQKVVAHLRAVGGVAFIPETRPARWTHGDAAQGKRLFASACSGCHGEKGEGGEGPALNNQVLLSSATDTYLVETIGRGRRGTPMPGFKEPSPVRPTLSGSEIESIVSFIRSWEKAQPQSDGEARRQAFKADLESHEPAAAPPPQRDRQSAKGGHS